MLDQPARIAESPIAGGLIVTHAGATESVAEARLAPDASGAVELRFGGLPPIRVWEEGSFGPATREGDAAGYARSGGRSYWTVAEENAHAFEEWLDIEAGHAFADRVLARWEVAGATLREVPETGGVHVLDEQGEPRVYVSAPRAWASSGRPVEATLSVEDGRIALRVDADGDAVLVDPMWVPTGAMSIGRWAFYQGYGAVPVTGGALVIGGYNTGTDTTLATVERYTTATGTWASAGAMITRRYAHTTTVLADGRVLATGGDSGVLGTDLEPTAELRDPATGTWTATGSMSLGRAYHTATLLADGRVLVTGGYRIVGSTPTPTPTAELYDPATGTWTAAAPMASPRYLHHALRLGDGRVLVAGGHSGVTPLASAEIFNPATGTWAAAAPMAAPRYAHAALTLADGRPLVLGGSPGGSAVLASAEIYDPAAGTWGAAGSMVAARGYATASLLGNGHVIVTGGLDAAGTALASTEIFDPATSTFAAGGSVSVPRYAHVSVGLSVLTALVAGGSGDTTDTATSDVFTDDAECGNGVVEPGETCDDGNTTAGDCCSATCVLAPATTVCRAAVAGDCDVAETCGGAGTCPADSAEPEGTLCGEPTTDVCGERGECVGTVGATATCEVRTAPTTQVCRPATLPCDTDDFCDGAGSCTADAARPEGSACGGAPSGVCDAQDTCSGTVGATSTCEARFAADTVVCSTAGCSEGVQTEAATCTGTSAVCPAEEIECDPYVCGATACTSTCEADDDCAPGASCREMRCIGPVDIDGGTGDGGTSPDASDEVDGGMGGTGGGGCDCSVPSRSDRGAGAALLLSLAIGLVIARRRVRR